MFFESVFFSGPHSSFSADVNRKLATGLINKIPVLTWRCLQSQETNYKNPGFASFRFVISGRSCTPGITKAWAAGTPWVCNDKRALIIGFNLVVISAMNRKTKRFASLKIKKVLRVTRLSR